MEAVYDLATFSKEQNDEEDEDNVFMNFSQVDKLRKKSSEQIANPMYGATETEIIVGTDRHRKLSDVKTNSEKDWTVPGLPDYANVTDNPYYNTDTTEDENNPMYYASIPEDENDAVYLDLLADNPEQNIHGRPSMDVNCLKDSVVLARAKYTKKSLHTSARRRSSSDKAERQGDYTSTVTTDKNVYCKCEHMAEWIVQ